MVDHKRSGESMVGVVIGVFQVGQMNAPDVRLFVADHGKHCAAITDRVVGYSRKFMDIEQFLHGGC